MKKIRTNKIVSFVLAFLVLFSTITVSSFSADLDNDNVDNNTVNQLTAEEINLNNELIKEPVAVTIEDAFKDTSISKCEYIYNLDDSADYIYVEFSGGGYAVFAKSTMEMMEFSPLGTLPYENSNAKKYYGGPANYLHKAGTSFVNMATGERFTVTAEKVSEFSAQTRNMINSKTSYRSEISSESANLSDAVSSFVNAKASNENSKSNSPPIDDYDLIQTTVKRGTLIANYPYFLVDPYYGDNIEGFYYGNNNIGTCGPVAAQLLLSFNNYYKDRRIIEDRYLFGNYGDNDPTNDDPSKNPNYCSDPMSMTQYTLGTKSEGTGENSYYYKVISAIMEPYACGSTISEVTNGINDILLEYFYPEEFAIDYEVNSLGISPTPIKNEIDRGRPVILLMQESLGGLDHFVVGYGYQTHTYSNNQGRYDGYVVHMGWRTLDKSATCTWINESWCVGYIALEMKHEHIFYVDSTNPDIYKCACGYRTYDAIIMESNDSYIERVATIEYGREVDDGGNYPYKDYYIKFYRAGNKMFQTFGNYREDTEIYLYDVDYNLLAYNTSSGYEMHALMNYTVQAYKPYILRVKYANVNTSGNIKVAITPAYTAYTSYENILTNTTVPATYNLTFYPNATRVATFTPTQTGTYRFNGLGASATSTATCLYVIDPSNQNTPAYYDEGYGALSPSIEVALLANTTYFVVYSRVTMTNASGQVSFTVEKISSQYP